ncbi:MAG: hypothetical protein ACRENO_02885 [Thermodesulfobacteriota bacterium]
MELDELKNDIIVESSDDEVGLWLIIWLLENHYQIEDVKQRKEITIRVIQDLLNKGLIKAMDYWGPEHEWALSTEETINRIKKEWEELDHEPNINEIVRFEATEKGDLAAKKLLEEMVIEISKRKRELQIIINIIEPDRKHQPTFITDKTTLIDLLDHDEREKKKRLKVYFNDIITTLDFNLPVWKLIDKIKKELPNWPKEIF